MRVYIVATNADYSVLLKAEDEKEAVKKADYDYYIKYDEHRDDWEAYLIEEWLEEDDVFAIKNFDA